jgi:hypothetical protein
MTIQPANPVAELATRSVSERDAIDAAEANAVVIWRGDRLPYRSVPERIAQISGRAARNALAAAHQEATEAINPLREVWYAARLRAAREMGFDDLVALHEAAAPYHLDEVVVEAQTFLFESETVYFAALRRYLALIDIELGDATEADLSYILRGAGYASWFEGRDLPQLTQRVAADLGTESSSELPDAGGHVAYASALREAGRRIAAGDASASADPAVDEGFGVLFERLLLDGAWLEDRLGVPESEIPVVADFLAFTTLHALRRDAAQVIYALRLHRGAEARLARAYYSGTIGLITGAAAPESDYLARLGDGLGFDSANALRASDLAGTLRVALEAAHGRDWWRQPAALPTLRDARARGAHDARDVVAHLGYNALDWRPVLRQVRTQLIGEMSGYGGPNITTRAGTRKV